MQRRPMPKRKTARKIRKIGRAKKVSPKFRLAMVAVIALGTFSFLVLLGISTYKIVFKSDTFAFSGGSYSLKEEDLVVVSKIVVKDLGDTPLETTEISIVFYDKEGKRVLNLAVPLELNVETAGKFGEENISKVLALGEINSADSGEAALFLNETLQKLIGFNIDRFVLVDEEFNEEMDSLLLGEGVNVLIKPKTLARFFYHTRTNLSFGELFDSGSFASGLPSDRFSEVSIGKAEAAEGYDNIDEIIQNLTFDSALAQERKSVAVLNGSGVSGVANFGTRVVENLGGRVVSTDNAYQFYEQSMLIVDDKTSETATQLNKFFEISDVIEKAEVPELRESVMNRADVTLILGVDMAERLR